MDDGPAPDDAEQDGSTEGDRESGQAPPRARPEQPATERRWRELDGGHQADDRTGHDGSSPQPREGEQHREEARHVRDGELLADRHREERSPPRRR